MTDSRPYELSLSRNVLRVLMFLNVVFGIGILAMLIGTFVAEGFMMRALIGEHGASFTAESHTLIAGMRWIMALGVIAVVLMQVALKRLYAIVETVSAGD